MIIGPAPPLVVVPTTEREAVEARSADPRGTVVAGGTDVMVSVNAGSCRPSSWLSVHRIRNWAGVERDAGRWRIGSAVTLRRLESAPSGLALLAAAARTVGSPQIRSAATIGGNVVTASPAGDLLPALQCLDAEVEVCSVRGRRFLALSEFLVGPRRTALEPDELVAAFVVADRPGPSSFAKHATRSAMAISKCSLAVQLDDSDGPRVSIGSLAPTARRVAEAEWIAAHRGGADAFAASVVTAAEPIDDHRSTAAHRLHAVAVLARRAYQDLVDVR